MKVEVVVTAERVSRREKSITIRIVNTDNAIINDFLDLPKLITKSYPKNTPVEDIRSDIKLEITSLIDSIKDKIKNNGLQGKTITFNV